MSISKYSGETCLHGSLMFQEAIRRSLVTIFMIDFPIRRKGAIHTYTLQTLEPISVILYDEVSPHAHPREYPTSPTRQLLDRSLRLDKRLCHHHDV